jgi:hypothetical protein
LEIFSADATLGLAVLMYWGSASFPTARSKIIQPVLRSALWRKLIQQFPEPVGVVTPSFLEFICRLGFNQICIGVENEDVRVAMDVGEPGQESLIRILLAHADFHRDVVPVSKRHDVRMQAKKRVHKMAPTAPFASNLNKDISPGSSGLCTDHSEVFFRITPRIISINHFIARLQRGRFLRE